MAKFEIQGNCQLKGELPVYGAKNAAMKMIAASILINGKVTLTNVPRISDIENLCLILEQLGAKISRDGHKLEIETNKLVNLNPDSKLVRMIRASVVLVGPLLARFGQVEIPHPGGDKIGSRPINLHLQAFRELGVIVAEEPNNYLFRKNGQIGNRVHFKKISVTGTENILLFACLQDHEIIIDNAAIEPEIIDLVEFLQKAGASIKIDGRRISICGKNQLQSVSHHVIPDRIEAGTFIVLAAAAKSQITITNLNPSHLTVFLDKLKEIGVQFDVGSNFIYIKKSPKLRACDISTAEYPGFSTDWQPPIGLLLTQAEGKSHITENIFENRLGYLKELQDMGAKVKLINNCQAEITGPTPLHGAVIKSLDIRSGATLLIAGLIAENKTIINHAENVDRGYEEIEKRLTKIGAKILRLQ